MRLAACRRRQFWRVSFLALGCTLLGCDAGSPEAERKVQTRPVAPAPESMPAAGQRPPPAPLTTQPTKPATVTRPGSLPAKPAREPIAAEPELPEYLTIVERFSASDAANVQAQTEGRHRLVLETRNVRRLHIDRDKLPLDKNRSIALVLDGQGIEWLAGSQTVEFERSRTGEWTPVKPGKSGQTRQP